MTLRDLDPGATVYGSYKSINTNYVAYKAKRYSRGENAPRYDRSHNSPILSEHDLTYDVITSSPDMVVGKKSSHVSN